MAATQSGGRSDVDVQQWPGAGEGAKQNNNHNDGQMGVGNLFSGEKWTQNTAESLVSFHGL